MIDSKIPDVSLTAVKFPDISRFSRQVVTLVKAQIYMVSLLNFINSISLTDDIQDVSARKSMEVTFQGRERRRPTALTPLATGLDVDDEIAANMFINSHHTHSLSGGGSLHTMSSTCQARIMNRTWSQSTHKLSRFNYMQIPSSVSH